MHRKENSGPIGDRIWLNRQSVAGLTCAPKSRKSIHTRMRLFQNTSRKLSVLPGKVLTDPCPAFSSANHSVGDFTEHLSGFVHWHWEVDRYLGPLEGHGEVKNISIKVLPLAPGSPQMPLDIMYNAIEF